MNIVPYIALLFVLTVGFASLFLLGHYFLFKADTDSSVPRQKLSIGIFSLLVTSLVILLGLLPQTQSALGTASGTVGIITFNIAGPPAIWAAIFLIVDRTFKVARPTRGDLGALLQSHYILLGFRLYREWKKELNKLQAVFFPIEMFFIDDLLPKVFYHGPYGLRKPRDVRHSTLFVYAKDYAVKFQRIRGNASAAVDTERPYVYCPASGSTDSGRIRSLYLTKGGDGLFRIGAHAPGEWKLADLDDLDALLISVYAQDTIEGGDYIYLDVSKYVNIDNHESAIVDFVLLSDRTLDEFGVWHVAPSLVSTERPVPLMFSSLVDPRSKRGSREADKARRQVKALFGDWQAVLDGFDRTRDSGKCQGVSADDVARFFSDVIHIVGEESFGSFFSSYQAADAVSCVLTGQSSVVLIGFCWQ